MAHAIYGLLAFSILAPAPSVEPIKSPYFALDVGIRFTFNEYFKNEETHVVRIFEISKVDRKKSSAIVTLTNINQRGTKTEICDIEVSDKGVQLLKHSGQIDPFFRFIELHLPLREGEEWSQRDLLDEGSLNSFKVIGEEEITVKAGKFKAIRVDTLRDGLKPKGMPIYYSMWFAPNVGIVKYTIKVHKTDIGRTYELKSFEPKK